MIILILACQEKKDQITLLVVTSVILLFSPIILEFDSPSSCLQLGVPSLFAYVFISLGRDHPSLYLPHQ